MKLRIREQFFSHKQKPKPSFSQKKLRKILINDFFFSIIVTLDSFKTLKTRSLFSHLLYVGSAQHTWTLKHNSNKRKHFHQKYFK